ncbi:berberine bridge enzyme-like 13 [Abeliophyllum distichum]|uniref:Berberine bridge enzyme-like 13 n=1 Tax=Abeliophyllum distichum TaxID=126358 RepID=A0ABD1QXL6_9LAMI
MPRMKMAVKRLRRERLPSPSSDEEAPPLEHRIDKCPIPVVSFCDEVVISPKPTNTINIRTLKRMKIIKKDGQWVAQSKGFDNESGPSTLLFEGGEEMDEDEEEPPPSQRPSSSTSDFTEDHFNLLNRQIDSLKSSMEGLHYTAEDLHHTMGTLQQSMDGMTLLLQALYSRLYTMIPPPPPPEF